ncbi:hypothetical protein [Pseudanabaena sp. FACHB-2040]|uniref:hypothetical protein n=1 Tax=Pseudanabaena sp. FACHB-2040 TaxID=2692859 RepID=UPI00168433E3|nr:hypothetical protein [Pseudanabaena sp. FACHB-2040]MBD2259490.1 hypothetical protein [Pseudanabaena sp. FACHB-2040]
MRGKDGRDRKETRYEFNQRELNRVNANRQYQRRCSECLHWRGTSLNDISAYCAQHHRSTPCTYHCSLWQHR